MKEKKAAPRKLVKAAAEDNADTGQSSDQSEKAAPESDGGSSGIAVIALGGSAGALESFKTFFTAMPADSGAAFVVIQHLAPTHVSLLTELLAQHTTMKVVEAQEDTPVEPNCVYVIPPRKYLGIRDGVLYLTEPMKQDSVRMPIDFFFRALAEDRQERGVCVLFSGAGSDGTLGVRAIRGAGGLTVAQDPATAQFADMPRSAIATKLVDYVLPPQQMPQTIMEYLRQPYVRGGEPTAVLEAAGKPGGFNDILAIVLGQTGCDFRCYKKSTILRRIERRMGLRHLLDVTQYSALLRQDASEVGQLLKDLLINVTAFFRDSEAFEDLQRQAIAPLLAAKQADEPLRIWVAGCSTGEEAYSLVMLLMEEMAETRKNCPLQVFATDIDEEALAAARLGLYPESIAADVSAKRLARFFVRKEQGYQVSEALRNTVVFAAQNLITDPPFSKMDLISCRNLLIYLDTETQTKLIPMFNFALNPGGYLFLGKSEGAGSQSDLFSPVSKKARLFRRSNPVRPVILDTPIVPGKRWTLSALGQPAVRTPVMAYADVIRQALLNHFAASVVLVDPRGQILQFHGPTGKYLNKPASEPNLNLLDTAKEGLALRLRSALHTALDEGKTVVLDQVPITREKDSPFARVTIQPLVRRGSTALTTGRSTGLTAGGSTGLTSGGSTGLTTGGSTGLTTGGSTGLTTGRSTGLTTGSETAPLLAVIFEDTPRPALSAVELAPGRECETTVAQLEDELRTSQQDFQASIEELQAANEELRVSNQEVVSSNEELQSTSEELETSKEELQSVNEELTTVNSQLQEKVEQLAVANSDLANLLHSTQIATLFLDGKLRIKFFTPETTRVLKVISSDLGRQISDLSINFLAYDLAADARTVVQHGTIVERDVRHVDGSYYVVRLGPYRTPRGQADGVVATFTDVTRLRQGEQQMRLLATVIKDSNDAVVLFDHDGAIQAWNRGAQQLYGWNEAEALRLNLRDITPADRQAEVVKLTQRLLAGEPVASFDTQRQTKDGRVLEVWLTATAVLDETRKVTAIATTERDITERRKREVELGKLNRTLKALSRSTHVLTSAMEEAAYLAEVCHIIVEDCGHAMVWIGYAENDQGRTVRPMAWDGFAAGYLETLEITWADTARGRGPTGMAIRTGQPVICRNMLADPLLAPWREEALKRGYASSIALPLHQEGKRVFGALTIYCREPDPFTEDEVELLSELAEDLAHGVISLRLRAAHARAEAALRVSENRYRTLFNEMTEGFALHEIILDEHGAPCDYRFLEANPAFERLTGLKLKDIIGRTHNEVMPGDDPIWHQKYGEVALTGQSIHFENYSSPLQKYYEVFAYHPAPHQFAVLFLDITERKRADEAQRESERRERERAEELAILLEAMPTPVFIAQDPECLHLASNPAANELLRNPRGAESSLSAPADVKPRHFKALKDGRELRLDELPAQRAAHGEHVKDFEFSVAFDDGTIRHVLGYGTPLADEQGRPRGAVHVLVDITARKEAEEALRLSEEKFARAFAGNPAAIAMTRVEDGLFLDVNDTWVALNGYTREEVIGLPSGNLPIWPSAETRARFIRELREKGSLRGWEQEFRRKSGELFVAELSAQILTVRDEKVILSTLVDVTPRKRAEEAVALVAKELERSNQDLEQFAYVASHDLQEPLRTVNNFVKLLQERYQGRLDEKADEFIGFAVDGATRMQALIRDLLAYSRVGSKGKHLTPTDVEAPLDRALANLKMSIEESGAAITWDKLPTVNADPAQLAQLFQNLIGNALKFRGDRKPEIRIAAAHRKGEWIFSIRDNGIGLDMAQRERIFQVFQRLHARDKYAGTGIGLAICKKIVEHHDGRIWVESELGQGAAFFFTIPD